MAFTTSTTTAYPWGKLTIVRRGSSYSAVIHPEHLSVLRNGGRFTDETGTTWRVTVEEDGTRTLKSGSYRLAMTPAEVAIALA